MSNNSKKEHLRVHLKEIEKGLIYEVREVVIGFKIIVALLGFSIGVVFVTRSLWEYAAVYLGLPWTIILGIIIFAISGWILKKFKA